MINPLTAWLLTLEEHKLRHGDWLVQTAAGSVVGRLVLQIAKAHGFHTINLVRRQTQVAEIKALGGDVVICTTEPDWAAKLNDATGGTGVEKAIDCVAGRVGATVAPVLRLAAVCLSMGRCLLTARKILPHSKCRYLRRG